MGQNFLMSTFCWLCDHFSINIISDPDFYIRTRIQYANKGVWIWIQADLSNWFVLHSFPKGSLSWSLNFMRLWNKGTWPEYRWFKALRIETKKLYLGKMDFMLLTLLQYAWPCLQIFLQFLNKRQGCLRPQLFHCFRTCSQVNLSPSRGLMVK